jgi:predicted alpha/beta-fold hydrolase
LDRCSGAAELPAFEPHPWLRGGHSQTIIGRYWPVLGASLEATTHIVDLADGDRLVVLDSVPPGWESPRPAAVLVHGLAGCAQASYMVRLGVRLVELGVRVVRVNLRGSGSGFGLARRIYHAGRSDDLREVLVWLRGRAGSSPIALVGFSLGANLVLKLAAEAAGQPLEGLDCVLAANPPIDLAASVRRMGLPENRLYDWNFVRWLRSMVRRLHRRFPELGPANLDGVNSLYEFDDRYTAPRGGFASADDYYARCSLLSTVAHIAVPGLIVHARDDPFIPHEPFERLTWPANLSIELVRHGGHLGYLSRRPWQGDRRWLETRLTTWLKSRWA